MSHQKFRELWLGSARACCDDVGEGRSHASPGVSQKTGDHSGVSPVDPVRIDQGERPDPLVDPGTGPLAQGGQGAAPTEMK